MSPVHPLLPLCSLKAGRMDWESLRNTPEKRSSALFLIRDINRSNITIFLAAALCSLWPQLVTLLGENTCSYFTSCGLVTKLPFFKFFAKGSWQWWVLSQPLTSHYLAPAPQPRSLIQLLFHQWQSEVEHSWFKAVREAVGAKHIKNGSKMIYY